MTVFDFLGTEPRKDSHIVQHVKHWKDVTAKNKVDKMFGIQRKHDGVNAVMVVAGDQVGIFSRTGKKFQNVAELENRLSFLHPGVYMGELVTTADVSLEELSGLVNPNRKSPIDEKYVPAVNGLHIMAFDYITIEEFTVGKSAETYRERFANLIYHLPIYSDDIKLVDIVSYHCDEDAIYSLADEIIQQGEEGIVICDMEADWVAGHKGYRKMKIVRGVDYDLLCTGWEEGTGKLEGHVCNLLFKWKDGQTITAMFGRGWKYDMLRDMFQDINVCEETFGICMSHPVGKIFQVYALQESSCGMLRLPKVGELRHDKDQADI